MLDKSIGAAVRLDRLVVDKSKSIPEVAGGVEARELTLPSGITLEGSAILGWVKAKSALTVELAGAVAIEVDGPIPIRGGATLTSFTYTKTKAESTYSGTITDLGLQVGPLALTVGSAAVDSLNQGIHFTNAKLAVGPELAGDMVQILGAQKKDVDKGISQLSARPKPKPDPQTGLTLNPYLEITLKEAFIHDGSSRSSATRSSLAPSRSTSSASSVIACRASSIRRTRPRRSRDNERGKIKTSDQALAEYHSAVGKAARLEKLQSLSKALSDYAALGDRSRKPMVLKLLGDVNREHERLEAAS